MFRYRKSKKKDSKTSGMIVTVKKTLKSGVIIGVLLLALSLIVYGYVYAASTTVIGDSTSPVTVQTTGFSLTATEEVIAAVPGKKIKVFAYKLVPTAAMSVGWNDGLSTVIESPQALAANSVVSEISGPPYPLFITTAGNNLTLVISAGTGTVTGRISYWTNDSM